MVQVPWPALSGLKEEVARVIGECLGGRGGPGRQPLWDLIERPLEFMLLAEMAGVASESLEVLLSGSTLTVKGERMQELPEAGEVYHVAERGYGPFSRSLMIPGGVDAARIRAELCQGLLRVRLPKSGVAEARKIEVEEIS